MSNFAELDARILEILAAERLNWSTLHGRLTDEFGDFVWRRTDGRLQALRRKGLIRPVRIKRESVWEVVS